MRNVFGSRGNVNIFMIIVEFDILNIVLKYPLSCFVCKAVSSIIFIEDLRGTLMTRMKSSPLIMLLMLITMKHGK